MEVLAQCAKSDLNHENGESPMDVQDDTSPTDASSSNMPNRDDVSVNGTLNADLETARVENPWWLSNDPASVAANFKASLNDYASLKDISKDVIDLGDSSDDDIIEELNSHKTASIVEMTKLRPGLTTDDEVKIWANIFSVPPESVIRSSNKRVHIPSQSSFVSPAKRPKLKQALKSTTRAPLQNSPSRNSSYRVEGAKIPSDEEASSEESPSNEQPIRYPRLNPLISFPDEMVRQMLQRIQAAAPDEPEAPLTNLFQKIIRRGKFFDSSTLNEALGKYLASFANLPDAFKASLNIFWDSETLQSSTIPSKIDSYDLRPDQILPIIPHQHEFWTYWNTITDERHMPNAAGIKHSLVTIVGLINSKHNKSTNSPRNNQRMQRQMSDENMYYDVYSEESSSQSSLLRSGSSQTRSPRNAMSSMQPTRDSMSEGKSSQTSRSMVPQQRPSPHRSSFTSHRGQSSTSVDRRSSYTTSTPQQTSASTNHKFQFTPMNGGGSAGAVAGGDSCSSSNSNHKVSSSSNSTTSSFRRETSSKGIGREVGQKFDSLFQPRINEMLTACTAMCKPMSAQPKAEAWLPPQAIERMNNLQFFNDLGLNLHIGVLILSAPTIAAAVRSVAIVFWGQETLFTHRVSRPTSKTNMAPSSSSSNLEEPFHCLWNCILQFDKDDLIWERYTRAVVYINESLKKEHIHQQGRSSYSMAI